MNYSSFEARKDMLRDIQLTNLTSLKILDKICKKYHIQYWVAYGTLLGTIRHKGFIPWDDDLDICMLRQDYEHLMNVPKEEWEECSLEDGFTKDMRHDVLFPRIYLDKTEIQSYRDVANWINPITNKSWSTSMMCDIFVIDYVPDDNNLFMKVFNSRNKYLRKYRFSKFKYHPHEKGIHRIKDFIKVIYGFIKRYSGKYPWIKVQHSFEAAISSSPKGAKLGTYYTEDPYIYSYSDIFPLKEAIFEDMTVPIPNNYGMILSNMYGDYMQFPPEKDRYHINFIYADLGDKKYIVDPIPRSLGAESNNK